jgi:hypothetical protein
MLNQAKAQKRKRVETPSKTRLSDEQKQALKKKKQEFFARKSTKLPKTVQECLHQSIIDYIIADALPLSTVESLFFRAMLLKHNERALMMSVKHAKTLVLNQFNSFRENVISSLSTVSVVCLTADIWSSKNRSFLGVTLHWLKDNLTRVSHAIAIKRFKGDN